VLRPIAEDMKGFSHSARHEFALAEPNKCLETIAVNARVDKNACNQGEPCPRPSRADKFFGDGLAMKDFINPSVEIKFPDCERFCLTSFSVQGTKAAEIAESRLPIESGGPNSLG